MKTASFIEYGRNINNLLLGLPADLQQCTEAFYAIIDILELRHMRRSYDIQSIRFNTEDLPYCLLTRAIQLHYTVAFQHFHRPIQILFNVIVNLNVYLAQELHGTQR